MTDAPKNAPTVPASAPEPRADLIRYLTPTPPGFTPEYDYLALLQSLNLNDAAGRAIVDYSGTPPFRLPLEPTEDSAFHELRSHFINSSESYSWSLLDDRGSWEWSTTTKGETDWMYGQIEYTREKLIGKRQEGFSVLLVDNMSWKLLQILGAAIDLDPTFLWRHYNQDLDSHRYDAELARLRKDFFSFVATSKKGRAGMDEDQEPSISSTDEDHSIHLRYGLEDFSMQTHQFWGISCHISCYRFSANSWLILTRTVAYGLSNIAGVLPQPFACFSAPRSKHAHHPTRLPLHAATYLAGNNPIRLRPPLITEGKLGRFPEEEYDAFSRVIDLLTRKSSSFVKGQSVSESDFMFGICSKSLNTEDFGIVLQRLLIVSAWRANIRTFERQLQRLSYNAMSKPSLKAFRPIGVLRQYVVDMRYGLQREKDGVRGEGIAAFIGLQETMDHQLESLDTVFDALLRDIDALSAKASHEIQLVIGSVTIQDSDMMKRQSRRATLLTLLAAFYLPLSLVTGIFGMNIKEFSDTAPPFYMCFEALFAVLAVTAIFYGLYRYLPLVYRTSKKREARSQANPSRIHRCLHIISTPFRMLYHAFLSLERRRKEAQEDIELDD